MMMLVMGAAPMLAPLAGGWLAAMVGWRAIFWTLSGFGIACAGCHAYRIAGDAARTHGAARASVQRCAATGALLADRALPRLHARRRLRPGRHVRVHLRFAVRVHRGLRRTGRGLRLAVRLERARIDRRVAGQRTPGRAHRIGPPARPGQCGQRAVRSRAGGRRLDAASAVSPDILVPLFGYIASLGFSFPNAAAGAMAPFPEQAGSASALLGTVQFTIAAGAGAVVGATHDGTALPMAVGDRRLRRHRVCRSARPGGRAPLSDAAHAAIGRSPMSFVRHRQSAGTVCVRTQSHGFGLDPSMPYFAIACLTTSRFTVPSSASALSAATATWWRSTSKKLRSAARVSLRPKPSVPERHVAARHPGADRVGHGAHVVGGGDDRALRAAEALLDPGLALRLRPGSGDSRARRRDRRGAVR